MHARSNTLKHYFLAHAMTEKAMLAQTQAHNVHRQVRVDAVAALRNLMDAYGEDHLDEIKPHIPNLLDQLFRLMAEVKLFTDVTPSK